MEVLTPDFCGDLDAVARVLDAAPHVFNHNMETVPRLYRRVRPQADYRQSLDVLAFARRHAPGVLTKSGFMVGLGETEEEVHALLRDLHAQRHGRRHHRPVSAADAAQSAGSRHTSTRAVRRLSRLRTLARIQDGVQRTAGAQLLHGRRGQRRGAPGAVLGKALNWVLALLSAALLILTFPEIQFGVARAHRAGSHAAGRVSRSPAVAAFPAGLERGRGVLVRRLLLDSGVLASYAGVGDAAGWALFMLFCLAKAMHMGVFALLAGILMRRWWAVPAVAALWVAIEVTHGPLGFAWLALGNAGIDMAVPLRLAPITGVYGISFVFVDDVGGDGAGRAAPCREWNCCGWRRCCYSCCCLPCLRRSAAGSGAAGAAEYLRDRAVDHGHRSTQLMREQLTLSLRGC